MVAPIGILLVLAPPRASTMGKAPKMVAMLVIKMGLKRWVDASRTASKMLRPSSCFWLANSTIKIPFLVTMPTNTIIPIWLKIFNVKLNK